MGNNHQNPIPPTYPKHSHKSLTLSQINPQQKTLQLKIPYNEQYHKWKYNLYPIHTYQKYLILPKYFIDHGIQLIGCQSEESKKRLRDQCDFLVVGYQPFVYTLENQIMSRRWNQKVFTEREIWKIVKAGLIGLQCWNRAYKDIPIDSLAQKNILFNQQGQIKIAHQFSFPPQNYPPYNTQVIQYQKLNPRNTTIKQKQTQNQILTNSLYTIGLTILNMINIGNLFQMKGYDQNYQIQLLRNKEVSLELKNVVLHFLEKRVLKDQGVLEEVILIARGRCKENVWGGYKMN